MSVEFIKIEKDWDIVFASSVCLQQQFYSRHDCLEPGNRIWQELDRRQCTECGEPVPDSVQGLLTLLNWDRNLKR